MQESSPDSLETAAAAARRGELADWVAHFLASPGSDNEVLAAVLPEKLGWWAGPVELPIDRLQRLAGPSSEPVLCPVDEEEWDERVDAMEERAEEGWEPPPVVVSFQDGDLVLEDGNHRVEGLRRAGKREAWAVVGFTSEEDAERFADEWETPRPGGNRAS